MDLDVKKMLTIKELVCEVLDKMAVGTQFHGWLFKEEWVKRMGTGECKYDETFIRTARKYRRECFRVVNRAKSLYEKVEG